MWTIAGLPVHPLIIHAVVIFVPLAALSGMAAALWKWGRDRYGVLVLAAGLIAVVCTYLARVSGQQLYDSLPAHSPQMDLHMSIADPLIYWVLGLFAGLVVMAIAWLARRRAGDTAPTWMRVLHWIGAVLTWGFGIASLIVVVRAGDAGARAVWG